MKRFVFAGRVTALLALLLSLVSSIFVKDAPRLYKAETCAKTLLLTDVPSDGSALTLCCMQGLLANVSEKNLLFRAGEYKNYLPYTGCEVLEAQPDGTPWDFRSLLREFAPAFSGYILCDEGSAAAAISVAKQTNSLAVLPEFEGELQAAGLASTMDLRGKDDAWLRSSAYYKGLSRDLALLQPAAYAPRLLDYAVCAGAYVSEPQESAWKNAYALRFLKNGACVLGWNAPLGEYKTVLSLSRVNECLIPADHAYNLSVLSGFPAPQLQQHTAEDTAPASGHTVCLLMSDGDNLQWFLNSYSDTSHFGSALRGEIPIGWGVPASAATLAAPQARYLYGAATPNDEFVLSLSGMGYTFPSKWSGIGALAAMGRELGAHMRALDTPVLLVLDDGGFNSLKLDILARETGAAGLMYIDYSDYAGMEGRLRFSGGTPIVAAKYRLWYDAPGCSPEEIAASINAASKDPADPAAYSFVIVHAWSGIDMNGGFVEGGNTMKAVKALTDALDPDVHMVTPGRFVSLLSRLAQTPDD